jgi:hypothetical protein
VRAKILTAIVVCAGGLRAQTVPAGAGAELQQMAAHAAVIFAGQVVAVTRNDAAGFVDVRFRIDQAVRGAPASGAYVVREWTGLWISHPDRYRVGQRRLMLLTARSRDGFSAPVGGMDGAIPLVATGAEPLADGTGVAPADAAAGPMALAADLRWIAARAVRTVTTVAQPTARLQAVGVPAKPRPDPANAEWVGAIAPLPASASAASRPADLASVMALLGTRSKGSDARF